MSAGANCLLAAILFGAAMPLAKMLLVRGGPFAVAGLLYLGAAAATAPAAYRAGLSAIKQRDLIRLIVIALAGGVAGPALMMLALNRAPAASIALWLNLEVIATALLAWRFFDEDFSRLAGIGVATVAGAGILLALPHRTASLDAALLVTAACICWALDNNLTAIIDSFTPAQITLIKGFFGGLTNLMIGASISPGSLSRKLILAGLGLGALSYGASLILYIRGAQRLGVVRSQVIFASAPFIGCALSWLLLGEPIKSEQILTGGIMLGGLAMMFSSHAHEHIHPAMTHIHHHSHNELHHAHADSETSAAHTDHHSHPAMRHSHPHWPDLHHRHAHQAKPPSRS